MRDIQSLRHTRWEFETAISALSPVNEKARWRKGIAAFLGLHVLLHRWGMVRGHHPYILLDLALVVLPAAIAIAVAWPPKENHRV